MKNILPKNLFKDGFDTTPDPIVIDSLGYVRTFIKENCIRRKTINTYITSYRLKHIFEKIMSKDIANGDLIASMILEGYEYKECGKNAYFNITKKSITNLKTRGI